MRGLLSKKCETELFEIIDDLSYVNLGRSIIKHLKDIDIFKVTPVILCIGTDRATGDCLGPIVGTHLKEYHSRYKVVGDLKAPVHALNLKQTMDNIYRGIEDPFVIAIDASLGTTSHIGRITVSNCPISPGKGVHKKLPPVGDISITGIVNTSGQNPLLLQNTRLYVVMQLAECISKALKYSIDNLENS